MSEQLAVSFPELERNRKRVNLDELFENSILASVSRNLAEAKQLAKSETFKTLKPEFLAKLLARIDAVEKDQAP